MEQKLEIVQNGQYKNINLKSKPLKGIKGIEDGNYITVEKLYEDGLEKNGNYGAFYIVSVKYLDEQVSFILNKKENEEFNKVATQVGDKVKIIGYKKEVTNPKSGALMVFPAIKFEKVE